MTPRVAIAIVAEPRLHIGALVERLARAFDFQHHTARAITFDRFAVAIARVARNEQCDE